MQLTNQASPNRSLPAKNQYYRILRAKELKAKAARWRFLASYRQTVVNIPANFLDSGFKPISLALETDEFPLMVGIALLTTLFLLLPISFLLIVDAPAIRMLRTAKRLEDEANRLELDHLARYGPKPPDNV